MHSKTTGRTITAKTSHKTRKIAIMMKTSMKINSTSKATHALNSLKSLGWNAQQQDQELHLPMTMLRKILLSEWMQKIIRTIHPEATTPMYKRAQLWSPTAIRGTRARIIPQVEGAALALAAAEPGALRLRPRLDHRLIWSYSSSLPN